MPQTITTLLQSRDLVGLTLQAGTLGAGSAISWGTAVEMSLNGAGTATFKALEYNSNPDIQLFTPADWVIANYQIEMDDWAFILREVSNPSNIGAIMTVAGVSDYVRCVAKFAPKWARATAASQTQLVFIGLRGPVSFGIANGENIQQIEVRPIGFNPFIGAGNATSPI